MAVINAVADAFDSTKTYITAGGHSFVIDEPAPFGGEDTAASPVAMLLGSLAGCINAIGQWVANEMNFKIKHLHVNIDGEVDGTAFFTGNLEKRAGFSKIDVFIELDADIDENSKAIWLKNVIDRCPVTDNIKNMTAVSFEIK